MLYLATNAAKLSLQNKLLQNSYSRGFDPSRRAYVEVKKTAKSQKASTDTVPSDHACEVITLSVKDAVVCCGGRKRTCGVGVVGCRNRRSALVPIRADGSVFRNRVSLRIQRISLKDMSNHKQKYTIPCGGNNKRYVKPL